MRPTEVVALTKLVKAICPAQIFEDDTPATWEILLGDVSASDAVEAVKLLGRKQRFIAPSEILGEVSRIRAKRLDGVDQFMHLVDERFPDTREGRTAALKARRDARDRIADGEPHEVVLPGAALVTRPLPALGGVFRQVPRRD